MGASRNGHPLALSESLYKSKRGLLEATQSRQEGGFQSPALNLVLPSKSLPAEHGCQHADRASWEVSPLAFAPGQDFYASDHVSVKWGR